MHSMIALTEGIFKQNALVFSMQGLLVMTITTVDDDEYG